jgi:chemotaxis family two-component system response regulator Rcp1
MNDKTSRGILLVEDNPGDAKLALEALKVGRLRYEAHVVEDGEQAMGFLRREGEYADAPRPDLILLDFNLPKKDGRQVLAEIKEDENLRRIPVVVFTVSKAEEDILRAYDLRANCYITKPFDIEELFKIVRCIEDFWFTIVKLPSNGAKQKAKRSE